MDRACSWCGPWTTRTALNIPPARSFTNRHYPPGSVIREFRAMASAVSFCLHPTRGDDRGSITIINSDGTGTAESFGDFSSLYGLAWSPKGDEVWFTADPTAPRSRGVSWPLLCRELPSPRRGAGRLDAARRLRRWYGRDRHRRSRAQNLLHGFQDSGKRTDLARPCRAGRYVPGWQTSPVSRRGERGRIDGHDFPAEDRRISCGTSGRRLCIALSPDQKWVLAITPSNPPRHL